MKNNTFFIVIRVYSLSDINSMRPMDQQRIETALDDFSQHFDNQTKK